MPKIQFTKMAGAGNDFILVDNRAGGDHDWVTAARVLCRHKESVGADGLIVLERSDKADYGMRIFNPDGSEAEMCGNGVRCLARYAFDAKIAPAKHSIETKAGMIGAGVEGAVVRVRLADPRDLELGLTLQVNGEPVHLNTINTGVPHAVVFEGELEDVDVFGKGRAIRRHSHFAPRGTNVNFVSVRQDENTIRIRTYERGVEDETLACGTGSVAGALVAAAVKGLESPVVVRTQGGDSLKVHFVRQTQGFREVSLEGPVQKAFEGSVEL